MSRKPKKVVKYMKNNKKKDYVNNKEFLQAIKDYKKQCLEAENAGEEPPKIPDYIGICLNKISYNLAKRPNFSGYTYVDEMVSDGLENAIQALGNFDPEKTSNPFGYFTKVIWFAFLRRIEKEKKELYIRYKVTENSIITGKSVETDSNTQDSSHLNVDSDSNRDFIQDFEDKIEQKRKRRVERKLEKQIEESNNETTSNSSSDS